MPNHRSLLALLRLAAYLLVFAALLWPMVSMVIQAVHSGRFAARKAAVVEYQQADDPQVFRQFLPGAVAASRVPVAHFYADWCGPCRRFKAALPDPLVDEALHNTTLVEINIDSCQALAAYYGVTAVPTFVKLDAQGRPLARITSDEWDEDTPAAIAPVLAALVRGRTYDEQ